MASGEIEFDDEKFRFGDESEWSFVGLLTQNIKGQFTYVKGRLVFHNRMAFHFALQMWYALTGCKAIGSLNFNNKPQSF